MSKTTKKLAGKVKKNIGKAAGSRKLQTRGSLEESKAKLRDSLSGVIIK